MDIPSTTAGQSTSSSGVILRMARAWQSAGQFKQAIDAYSRLLSRYPSSAEAPEAMNGIIALAQAYERQGQYRLALALYEKLEGLP